MVVVGFDVGNDNCVIAVVKHRGVDVLLNDESNRENPAVVSFGEKQRFFGAAAAVSATMNPRSTVSNIKRLVGLNLADPEAQRELRRLPFATSAAPDGGVLVHLSYLGETRTFTPVQIAAMLFSHLKHLAEKGLGEPVSDCVIGIPCYFTDSQRRGYLDAATIAGLRPLRLLHDCTATALGYGIYKAELPIGATKFVVFVDIGHCDTQVSVVSFEAGSMRVLSHTYDRCLGGRDFDEVLFEHFAEQFKEKYSLDVYSNVRACIRLRAACEKLKKVLSANAEAPINIECLMDETDVRGYIKREEFERLCSGLLERVRVPCCKALVEAGLDAEAVNSVELVGSGSRIPAITKMLTALFGKEPSRTQNASECVARGCALQGAMLSPIYRVKDYEVQDALTYSIGISTDEGPISSLSNNALFTKGQAFPTVKMLTFYRSNMFRLDAFYVDANELPVGASPIISSFTIGPFQVSHPGKSKIKIRVQLNLHGIVVVESAVLVEDEQDDQNNASGLEDNGTLSSSSTGGIIEENGFHLPYEFSTDASVITEGRRSSGADGFRNRRACKRLEIPINEVVYGGMSKAEVSEACEKEMQLCSQDRLMEQTKDKRNALEAFIYDTRNKLLNLYRNFSTDEERETVSRSLHETQEWLYDDGDDESENVYASRLEELKKLVEPIESRYRDDQTRDQAAIDLLRRIEDYRLAVKSLTNSERDLVLTECSKAKQWLDDKRLLQDSMPKNCDPVLSTTDIRKTLEELERTCNFIFKSKGSKRHGDGRGSAYHARTDSMETD